jgi:hypothetical protein
VIERLPTHEPAAFIEDAGAIVLGLIIVFALQ